MPIHLRTRGEIPNTAVWVRMKFDAPPSEPLGESLFSEFRQTHVRTSCDIGGCVCLRVQVLGEMVFANSVEPTVTCGAEPRRLTPIVCPGRHTGLLAGCATQGSAHMIAWRNPSCPARARVTH